MVETVHLSPHDPLPEGPGRQVVVLRRWEEDDPGKTTVQLVALAIEMLAVAAPEPHLTLVGDILMWIAAALTLWTGWGYLAAMARALRTT